MMQFDEIVEPYFDALNAPLIVKNSRLGDAKIPTNPKTGEPFADHALRMDAAYRIVDLFGGKPREIEMPSEPPKKITIIFQKDSSAQVAVVVNPTGRTSIVPEGATTHPKLPVTLVKRNGKRVDVMAWTNWRQKTTIELQGKNKHPPLPVPQIGFNCTSPTCFR